MPIFEILCQECGRIAEVLVSNANSNLICPFCGGSQTEKQISAPSSLTGRAGKKLPGPADHACCGDSPAEAGCAGPGSCCGKVI